MNMAVAVIASCSVFEATVNRLTEHGMRRLTIAFLFGIITPFVKIVFCALVWHFPIT